MVQRKPISKLIGKRVGRLSVVEYDGVGKFNKHYWECLCDCGNYVTLPTYRLTGSSPTLSCGCLRKDKLSVNRNDPTKHGLSSHPLYAIYYGMVDRCTNPNNRRYKYYGGKGIAVSEEFDTFLKFFVWSVENGWSAGLSVDRVDSSKDYCPNNCEWVTVSENSRRMHDSRRNEKPTRGKEEGDIQKGSGST